jgi:hypothetical protein
VCGVIGKEIAWEVNATSISIIAGNDCDIGDSGGVRHREERKQNGEDE